MKGRHFTNPDLRLLDEALEALTERVAELEQAARAHVSYSPGVITRYSDPQVTVEVRDEPAREATQDVADGLRPDSYYLKRGFQSKFQVIRTADGEAMHEGWLVKDRAKAYWDELMAAGPGHMVERPQP